MIPSRRFLRWLTIVALLLLPACTNVPAPRGADDQPLQRLTALAPAAIFAGSSDRQLVAYGKGGLQLLEITSGRRRQLDDSEPRALGWRHDDEQLAAAFADGRLVVFDRAGSVVSRAELPGTPVAVAWSRRQELLIAGFRLKRYSFGVNLAQWLVRYDSRERELFDLGDVTLKPATADRLSNQLAGLLNVSFSPEGDELIMLRLYDPPQFPAYLQLIHRNWQAPGERKLLELPVQPVALDWGAEPERINYRVAGQPWHSLLLWPPAGEQPHAAAPSAELSAAWGVGTRLQRFADGHYLLAVDRRLYAGSGLPERPLPTAADKAWILRKWRFEGLITPEEYREVRP
jgi:hypothetical protein